MYALHMSALAKLVFLRKKKNNVEAEHVTKKKSCDIP